ncbi:hypothetical protein SAMN05444161_4847 [Rhizobiales bacterium GAS191]|jgi:hypothetical protein|nr:hypothetical protein SAMN05519103_04123 [Rhizobiales bacterium GAS113]SEE09835.1 hypothetical protein SAMN05444161_4847 [Rhizobiales bacterium GAS191]SEE44534.1 hypothetical protein SAMN05519104_6134 [Rhizobiales bacterium GAS188]
MIRLRAAPCRAPHWLAGAALLSMALASPSVSLAAGSYEFVAAPATDLNRVYRVDRSTGEMGACQYGLQEGTIGVTICYPAGEGGSAQAPGDYTILASRHDRESGVFRLNLRNGEMSNCYVLEEKVVCTPWAK